MADALGIAVVAEGVETEAQLAQLRLLGYDLAQGHYFARARPADEARRFFGAALSPQHKPSEGGRVD